jgi:hypothetical protein
MAKSNMSDCFYWPSYSSCLLHLFNINLDHFIVIALFSYGTNENAEGLTLGVRENIYYETHIRPLYFMWHLNKDFFPPLFIPVELLKI